MSMLQPFEGQKKDHFSSEDAKEAPFLNKNKRRVDLKKVAKTKSN